MTTEALARRVRRRHAASFEDGKMSSWNRAKERRQPLEGRKGKETALLALPETVSTLSS